MGIETVKELKQIVDETIKNVVRNSVKYSLGEVKTSFIRNRLPPEEGGFDHQYSKILTRAGEKPTGKMTVYKFIAADAKCTVLNDINKEFPIGIRIVRFKLPTGEYECLATNLAEEDFSIEELRELYNKRWEIESRIRDLNGLNMLHSRIKNSVKQEIFAKLMLFNFSSLVANSVEIEVEKIS